MTTLRLLWTPAPDDYPAADTEALILSQEHLQAVTARLTVTTGSEPGLVPATLNWRISGNGAEGGPLHITVTVSKTGNTLALDIVIADWVGLFAISIEYMTDFQQPHTVDDWDAVPGRQADIYAYRPDSRNVRRFPFEVDAVAASGSVIETATYTITVYANYTVGKNALQEKVKERVLEKGSA